MNKKGNAFSHFKSNNLLLKPQKFFLRNFCSDQESKRFLTCKKAQEDSTLVWIAAVFVILFILIVFIGVAFSMSTEKSFNWESKVEENGILYTGNIALSQNLLSILDSEIELNGQGKKAIAAIMDSYDLYFDTKSTIGGYSLIEKYGLNIYNVSRDNKIYDGFRQEDLDKIDSMNDNLTEQLMKVLNKYCTNYKLTIPQGVITEKGKLTGAEKLSANRVYFSTSDPPITEWTMVVQFPVTYRGMHTVFQFTELNSCSPYKRIGSQEKN